MARNRRIRKRRGTSWTSESSKRANKARWDADRERRDAEMPERIRELAEIETLNFPRKQGDAIGCLEWRDFRTGKVRRWVVRIGDRRDRMTMETPDGRKTQSHGWTYLLNHLRGFLAGTKS
jgi:hypothetical protein